MLQTRKKRKKNTNLMVITLDPYWNFFVSCFCVKKKKKKFFPRLYKVVCVIKSFVKADIIITRALLMAFNFNGNLFKIGKKRAPLTSFIFELVIIKLMLLS